MDTQQTPLESAEVARFYDALRQSPLSAADLAHGEATGQDAYVSMSLAALGWLFPA